MAKTRTCGSADVHRQGLRNLSYVRAAIYMSSPDAEAVVRCVPGDDHTNGFFVSCFIRKGSQESANGHKVDALSRKRSADGPATIEGSEGKRLRKRKKGKAKS